MAKMFRVTNANGSTIWYPSPIVELGGALLHYIEEGYRPVDERPFTVQTDCILMHLYCEDFNPDYRVLTVWLEDK